MSNPTNNFSSDLDPYDRLAQMLDGGLFKLLPLPPSWAKYVGAQYAQDPSLYSAPAPAIPGFRKLPDLSGPQASVASGLPSFDPLPAAPPPIEPPLPFPSELPGLDKAIARINAPTPGFHLTPGLGGFTRNASGPALSLPPLLPSLLTPSGGGFGALGSALPPTMSTPRLQPTSFDAPGLPPNTGLPDPSGLVQTGYPSMSPPVADSQAAPPTGDSSLILAQSNSTPMIGPQTISRPNGEPPAMPVDPYDIQARVSPPRPPMSLLPRPAASYNRASENWRGHMLVLPDGSTIDDSDIAASRSPTGHVMTPYLNLDEVAAAGRQVGEGYRSRLARYGEDSDIPREFFAWHALRDVGTGGRFDYQRKGNQFAGLAAHFISGLPRAFHFTQLRQFLPIANINVGVWSQQAGFTLDQTLTLAGRFAREFSSNARPNTRYGLDPRTEHFIREGYRIGQSGMFDRKGPSADTSAADQYEQQTKIGYPFTYEQPFTTGRQTPTVPPPGGPGWYWSP